MSDEHAHEPSEVTYAEYFHPARPKSLRYRTRVKQSFERHTVKTDGQPKGTNPAYVSWLLSQSMLADANTISPSGNMNLGDKYPIVEMNSIVKNPKDLEAVLLRRGENGAVFLRDVARSTTRRMS